MQKITTNTETYMNKNDLFNKLNAKKQAIYFAFHHRENLIKDYVNSLFFYKLKALTSALDKRPLYFIESAFFATPANLFEEFTKRDHKSAYQFVAQARNRLRENSQQFFTTTSNESIDYNALDALYEDALHYYNAATTGNIVLLEFEKQQIAEAAKQVGLDLRPVTNNERTIIKEYHAATSLDLATPGNWRNGDIQNAPNWASADTYSRGFNAVNLIQYENACIDDWGVIAHNKQLVAELLEPDVLAIVNSETFVSSFPGLDTYIENITQHKPAISTEPGIKYIRVFNVMGYNFYHWVIETLASLFLIKDMLGNEYKLIMPPELQAFQRATLALFDIHAADTVTIPRGQVLRSATILSTSVFYRTDSYNPELTKNLRQYLISRVGADQQAAEKLYYLKRPSAAGQGRRLILNEDELIEKLQARGFEIINPTAFSFAETISIMASAKCVVSMHGAAITNCLFMQANTSLIEVRNIEVDNLDADVQHHYQLLASMLGLNYYYIGGQPEQSSTDDDRSIEMKHHDNVTIDIDDVMACVADALQA